jgi:lipopolysaccharide/colanic/teichoic acid biosynthesis glycosyltransferase
MAAWMGVMALFSGHLGSEETMRRGLSWLAGLLLPAAEGQEVGESLPFFAIWTMRKLVHLCEYGALAVLARRWIRSLSPASPAAPWLGALGLGAVYALADEMHQAFVPGRTMSFWDVGIDLAGAGLALGLTAGPRDARDLALYRVTDLLGALLGLTLAAPAMLGAALAIRLVMGPPVLFRQLRLGRDERLFTLLKFRTMDERRDARGELLPGPQRLTRLGRWMRYLSLDELPQLWNVLVGDMSLVGPRPLFAHYLPYYTDHERTRHLVRPGLTGLAQVNGRNSLTWDEKLALDAQYIARKSLSLDLALIARTFAKVLRRSDVGDTALQGSLAEHRRSLVGRSAEGP